MNNLKINNLAGLHLYKLITKIINYGVDHMIYISCKPTSLARDLEVLLARGYVVDKVQCVDMFPNTVHVETVVLLSKGAKGPVDLCSCLLYTSPSPRD